MADRAVDDEKPDAPRDVFELDKDERWQARLEEARARREVALREKAAAGSSKKRRLKPWEVDGLGEDDEELPPINPIIQDPEDDEKVDFADRVETMREKREKAAKARPGNDETRDEAVLPAASDEADPDLPPEMVNVFWDTGPDEMPATNDIFTDVPGTAPIPERVREEPVSLILPGAPGVRELASRYASTLDSADDIFEPPAPRGAGEAKAEPRPKTEKAPIFRSIRRPLGILSGVAALALMPFGSVAPPLDKGPSMPVLPSFAMQPALGVTWSLYQRPAETHSGEWSPPRARAALGAPITGGTPPERPDTGIAALAAPEAAVTAGTGWTPLDPGPSGAPAELFSPVETSAPTRFAAESPDAPVAPEQAAPASPENLPSFGRVPAKPRPPSLRASQPDARPRADAEVPASPAAPLTPLRITVLAPARAESDIASSIAAEIPGLGHELVRILEVDYSISERNLRFFFEEDQAEAARLAQRYDAELRDFTWYRPKPAEGTVELWLSGRGAPAEPVIASPRPAPPETTENIPELDQQNIVSIRRPGLIGRIMGGLGIGDTPEPVVPSDSTVSGFVIPEDGTGPTIILPDGSVGVGENP